MDALGVKTVHALPRQLHRVPGLPGSLTLGMCNSHFSESLPELKRLDCRTVWVSCMVCFLRREAATYEEYGPPDFLVFQSEYQRSVLEPKYVHAGHNPERSHLIRGAFCVDDFPFAPRPHAAGEPFVVGRLARPDADKWNSATVRVIREMECPDRRAVFMGVNEHTLGKLGPAPDWCEYLPPGSVGSREFLSRCHALLCYNGGASENWPRVGLEAMAAGVPVVAENRWGWPEMIAHGVTGYLATMPRETTDFLDSLASNETERQQMIEAAREDVKELADQNTITAAWDRLFQQAETRP
jgi:glycosyltransferase involved in cell wall biosynthesis